MKRSLRPNANNVSRRQILVVDNDADNLSFLNGALAAQYDMMTANSGMDGLSAIYRHKDALALVLLSLALRRAGESDVLKQVIDDPRDERTRVFLSKSVD